MRVSGPVHQNKGDWGLLQITDSVPSAMSLKEPSCNQGGKVQNSGNKGVKSSDTYTGVHQTHFPDHGFQECRICKATGLGEGALDQRRLWPGERVPIAPEWLATSKEGQQALDSVSFPTMATEATKALLKPHRTFLYVGALLGPALSVSSLPGQKGPSRVGGKG